MKQTVRTGMAIAAFLLGWSMLGLAQAPAAATNAAGTLVLDTRSFWRFYEMFRDAATLEGGQVRVIEPKAPVPAGKPMRWNSLPPPATWTQPEFDDSEWWRAPGPFYGGYGFKQPDTVALLCLRGRFLVDNPAADTDLALSVSFRGGIVVRVNGTEIKRAFLPAGELTPDTPAEPYPLEAYAATNGKTAILWGWGDPAKYHDRCELRIRRIENVAIPPALLKQGANLICIEIHRAPYAEGARTLEKSWDGFVCHAGFNSLQLQSRTAAARPNVGRTPGFQVWNANPMMSVFDMDYGDPAESLHPVRLTGARNGTASGQAVVSCDKAINGLRGEVDGLQLKGGAAKIPSSAVQVRYAAPGGGETGADARYGWAAALRFDALLETPPATVPVAVKRVGKSVGTAFDGAVQPVWVTVQIPPDAVAGSYTGTLRLRAEGLPETAVPLELRVADWTLPDPKTYATFVDVVQSPDSVALGADLPLWSDKHWERMERSFRQLGRIGNKTVYLPMVCRTHFGNSEAMVRFVPQADGTCKGDFAPLERYLDLAEKYLGKPAVVCLYVWDMYCGGGYFNGPVDIKRVKKTPLTKLDPATGQTAAFEGPTYFEPEAEAFYRPVVSELRERLQKRGLDPSLMLGLGNDVRPAKEHVELWKKLLPGVPWAIHTHGDLRDVHGVPVKYVATVWQARFAPDPDSVRTYGWKNDSGMHKDQYFAMFHRDMVFDHPLTQNRLLAEYNVSGTQCGFGRNGADFWPVLKDAKGNRVGRLPNRYPETEWAQLSLKTCLFASGPDGALSTVRWEMMVESVQECEARIFLEKILLDPARRAKLGEEAAKRTQALLDERTRAATWGWNDPGWFVSSGWMDRTARLYDAAATAAATLQNK
jgi:hypothetical protein